MVSVLYCYIALNLSLAISCACDLNKGQYEQSEQIKSPDGQTGTLFYLMLLSCSISVLCNVCYTTSQKHNFVVIAAHINCISMDCVRKEDTCG